MYSLEDNGIIKQKVCGNNFEYILVNNQHFVSTDYKVLQNQTNGIFIQCMKILCNGKTALYYMTDEYKTLASFFTGITVDTFISIVTNLLSSIIEVKSNGFLACRCIDLSWDKIFVEQNTLKAKLIYLPFSVKVFDTDAEFESELRSSTIKLIDKLFVCQDERLNKLASDLRNGLLSLEDVYNNCKNPAAPQFGKTQKDTAGTVQEAETKVIKLLARNQSPRFEVLIDKDNMLLGKKADAVDAVIPFSSMISRKHCRIIRIDNSFYITDEGSKNGTFVNNIRVMQGQQCRIKQGDIVRLAESEFQII